MYLTLTKVKDQYDIWISTEPMEGDAPELHADSFIIATSDSKEEVKLIALEHLANIRAKLMEGDIESQTGEVS